MDVKVSRASTNQEENNFLRRIAPQAEQIKEEYRPDWTSARRSHRGPSNILLGAEKNPLDVINGESGCECVKSSARPTAKSRRRCCAKLAAVSKHVQIDTSPVRITDHGDHWLDQTKFESSRATVSARSVPSRRAKARPMGAIKAGQGLHRHEAKARSRRQDGRPSRQQGRGREIVCPKEDIRRSSAGTTAKSDLNPPRSCLQA